MDNPYDSYSISELLKCNQKLIENVQFFRENMEQFKINTKKIIAQNHELVYLRNKTNKVADYRYELKLDRQNKKNSHQEHIALSQVR